MEWMATITGDHVGYPGFQDLGDFIFLLGGAKILASKNLHIFRRRIFMVESQQLLLCFWSHLKHQARAFVQQTNPRQIYIPKGA